MARSGRHSKALTEEQIALLKKIQMTPADGYPNGYSLPALRTAMSAPFGFRVLGKALQGLPIWINAHFFISQFLERYQKAAAELAEKEVSS